MKLVTIFAVVFTGLSVLFNFPCFAQTVHYTSDGASYTTYSHDEKKQKKSNVNKKRAFKEKLRADAAKAAAAGYKVGQTVKEENGIIYKLAKDPGTGEYTFKLYRRVKRKKANTPPPVTASAPAKHAESKPNTVAEPAKSIKKKQKNEVSATKTTAEKKQTTTPKEVSPPPKNPKKQARTVSRPDAAGRNLPKGTFAVSGRHSFFERKTVPTKRILTESDGTTSNTTEITEGVGQKDVYFTDMHTDTIRLRYGILNSLEVFLDGGMTYDQFSDISDTEPVFGGGIRYTIVDVNNGTFSGLYLAASGEFLTGSLKESFDSGGNSYIKTIDWQEMTATLETGFSVSRFTVYAGCSYLMYTEDSTKEQVLDPPNILILTDEMEQQGNINFTGGVDYRFSPSLALSVELQTPNRQGGMVSIGYRF